MKFRPHHFLCTLGFQGKGYSPAFIANFQAIVDRLRAPGGGSVEIEVVAQTDSICTPCPNRTGATCTSEPKIQRLDHAHEALLGVQPGQRLTWEEAQSLIAQRVSIEAFHQACEPCSWRSLGVCEQALVALKKDRQARRSESESGRISGSFLAFLMVGISLVGSWVAAAATQGTGQVRSSIKKPAVRSSKLETKPSPLPSDLQALRTPSGWARIPDTSLYYDHAQALRARALQSSAQQALGSKHWSSAFQKARLAQTHWLRIQDRFSSSPWLKRLPEELGQADLLMAKASLGLGRPAQAREFFERAWDRLSFGGVQWSDVDAYFAVCERVFPGFWKDATGNSCTQWARRLVSIYPKQSPERTALGKRWKSVLEGLNDLPLAPVSPRQQQSYRVPDEDVAAWDALLPLLREGKSRALRRALTEHLEKFPRSALRQKARYWLAIGQIDDGEVPAEARSLLEQVARESPLSFYGLLAAQALKKDPEDFLLAEKPTGKGMDLRLHPSEIQSLRKAEALLQTRDPALFELARMELREVRAKDSFESDFLVHLADLNQTAGSYLGAFQAVTELIQRGARQAATAWAISVAFPVDRWSLILSQAEARGIDPVWVLSLMKQESAFDLGAISSSGAVGLMQVMPATAVATDPTITRVGLAEDQNNVRIGTMYMSQMLTRFRGNIALATAAYNAGPAAVERWMKEYGLKDTENGLSLGMLEFIESIPYKETRDYVGSIIRNYHWYSKRLPQELKTLPASVKIPQALSYFWMRTVAAPEASGSSNSK